MKELSMEEKAKAYDEALGRAKEKYAMFEGMKQGDVLEDVFPEIVESECELTWEDIDTMALEYVKKLNPTLSKLITKESLRVSYYLRREYDTYRQGLIDMYNKIKNKNYERTIN